MGGYFAIVPERYGATRETPNLASGGTNSIIVQEDFADLCSMIERQREQLENQTTRHVLLSGSSGIGEIVPVHLISAFD